MPSSGPSPRAALKNGESLRGLSVGAVPAWPWVLSPACGSRDRQPSLGDAAAFTARGRLGEPLPRARLYLGWVLFKQREDGQICKHAGFSTGAVPDYGSKRGTEKQFYLQAVWQGVGVC